MHLGFRHERIGNLSAGVWVFLNLLHSANWVSVLSLFSRVSKKNSCTFLVSKLWATVNECMAGEGRAQEVSVRRRRSILLRLLLFLAALSDGLQN